jgi:hypothetical protein
VLEKLREEHPSSTRCCSGASSTSSTPPTSRRCRSWSIRGTVASTPRSTRPWRPLASQLLQPNLQNIPVRTDLGRQIRQAIVPGEPGQVLLRPGLLPDRAADPGAPVGRRRLA